MLHSAIDLRKRDLSILAFFIFLPGCGVFAPSFSSPFKCCEAITRVVVDGESTNLSGYQGWVNLQNSKLQIGTPTQEGSHSCRYAQSGFPNFLAATPVAALGIMTEPRFLNKSVSILGINANFFDWTPRGNIHEAICGKALGYSYGDAVYHYSIGNRIWSNAGTHVHRILPDTLVIANGRAKIFDVPNANSVIPDDRIAAVSGIRIVRNGEECCIDRWQEFRPNEMLARTAIGISGDKKSLGVFVVENDRASRPGVTVRQLAHLIHSNGYEDGLMLDGSGSSALIHIPYVDTRGSNPVLTKPSDRVGNSRELQYRPVTTTLVFYQVKDRAEKLQGLRALYGLRIPDNIRLMITEQSESRAGASRVEGRFRTGKQSAMIISSKKNVVIGPDTSFWVAEDYKIYPQFIIGSGLVLLDGYAEGESEGDKK